MSNILVSEGGGGIWEGVYMTLAVAAYHWFLLHWSENLGVTHPLVMALMEWTNFLLESL